MHHTRLTDRRRGDKQAHDGTRRSQRSTAPSTVERCHRQLGNQAVRKLYERGMLHARLEVGSPTDAAEREADRTATQVLRTGTTGESSMEHETDRSIRSAPTGDHTSTVTASNNPVPAARGEALDARVRAQFESRFDADFEDVRVHRDAQAAEMTDALGARAFTVGRDLFFGHGEYDPASRTGRQLLAHELAHVVQQSEGGPMLQRQASPEGRRRSDEVAYSTDVSQSVMSLLTAEAYLLASPIGQYVEERLAVEQEGDGYRCLDEPQLLLLDEEEFQAAWVDYAVGAPHPDTDEPFTPQTAVAFLAENVRAFQDGQRTVVRFERSLPGITIHEVLHRLSGSWPSAQGHNVNEGITEYFTRLVIEGRDIPYDSDYGPQAAAVEELVDVVGIDAVASAYFEDSDYNILAGFRDAGLRYTNFERWVTAVREGEFVVASMILEGHHVSAGQGPMTPVDE